MTISGTKSRRNRMIDDMAPLSLRSRLQNEVTRHVNDHFKFLNQVEPKGGEIRNYYSDVGSNGTWSSPQIKLNQMMPKFKIITLVDRAKGNIFDNLKCLLFENNIFIFLFLKLSGWICRQLFLFLDVNLNFVTTGNSDVGFRGNNE